MRAHRAIATLFVVGFGVLGTVGACHETPPSQVIPPLTSAKPSSPPSTTPTTALDDVSFDAAILESAKSALDRSTESPWKVEAHQRSRNASGLPASLADLKHRGEVRAELFEGTKTFNGATCLVVYLTVAKGSMKVGLSGNDTNLEVGDVLVVQHPDPFEARVQPHGSALIVTQEMDAACNVLSRPASVKNIIRAKAAPELKWANGTMRAHLDVGAKGDAAENIAELYLGRLEGTASVAQHMHEESAEILIAIEGSGTFVLNGKEKHLSAGQIVRVPAKALHSWTPDPNTKLVAIQIYDPPGPEQRFVALSAGSGSEPRARTEKALDAASRDAGVK